MYRRIFSITALLLACANGGVEPDEPAADIKRPTPQSETVTPMDSLVSALLKVSLKPPLLTMNEADMRAELDMPKPFHVTSGSILENGELKPREIHIHVRDKISAKDVLRELDLEGTIEHQKIPDAIDYTLENEGRNVHVWRNLSIELFFNADSELIRVHIISSRIAQ